ncbi:MAG TPA: hypothetical protein VMF61_16390 [Candidatus Acidoferrales bacterium]|nr:hypothetical protein [Candidatus Acidoferrales bacterium]
MIRVTRGRLIRTGIAGAIVLGLGGCVRPRVEKPFSDDGYTYRQLTSGDRDVIAALAGAMLSGALPGDSAAHGRSIVEVVRGVDVAIDGLQPDVQGEVHQLFGLLQFPLTRALAAGVWTSWSDASPADLAAFLNRWRFSGLLLFRSGYQALHQLVMASWYGNAASWARIGYPGPPKIT